MTTQDIELSEDAGTDRYNVPALERGLRLLCEFSRENRTLSAPELARRFELPRATVFRLLSTLETMGFIERTEGGRDYRLGLAVLRLGFEYLASLELTELGTPLLSRLCDEIGTQCNLVVRDGRSIVYVAKVAPTGASANAFTSAFTSPFASSVSVGTRLPAHATVLGRVLLEDLSLPQLRKLYPEEKLERFSPATPRTTSELFDLVQADRARGHVLGEGFFEAHISSIAAPVRDHTGHVVAALGATLATPQIEAGRADEMVRRVRETADGISRLLNHSPASQDAQKKVVKLRSRA